MLAAVAVLGSCGGGGGGGTNPPPVQTRFTLSGTVTNSGGQPVAGAQVLLGFAEAATGADGIFAFANLQAGTYTISIQDSQGNFDCRSVSLSSTSTGFTFQLPADPAGFRITSVSPPLNSQGAVLDTEIRLETTAEPDLGRLAAGALNITPDIGEYELIYDAPDIIVRPVFQLPLNQTIIVELQQGTLSAGSQPLAHPVRWLFRSSSTDTSPPRLMSVTPAKDTVGHPPNIGVSFEFNEPVSIADPAFSARSNAGKTVTARALGRTVVVTPDGGWDVLSPYTVTIENVADTSGNVLTGQLHTSFTTSEEPAHSDDIQPEWNEALDLIVFSSSQSGGYDIFSIRPDGSELARLTNLPGDEFYPSLSADGSLLCFQKRGDSGRWEIWVQELEGGVPESVTDGEFNDTEPTFANTLSEDIIFTSDRVSPAGVYSMHFDGSNPVELDSEFNSSQSQPDVHPLLDTQILFTSNRGGSLDIWRKTVSAIDGTALNLNLTGDTLADEFSPSWSADAGSFVYVSNDGGTDNLWLADAAGEFPRQITAFDVDLAWPEMSPFAGSVECVASIDSSPEGASLVLVDLVSGEITLHLTGPEASNQ